MHEAPRLARANQPLELQAGMVVTVEPGVYLPGWGGVRIEDDVLVTRDGLRSAQFDDVKTSTTASLAGKLLGHRFDTIEALDSERIACNFA